MDIEFKKISGFHRGILYDLLADAYSFDSRCGQCWGSDWRVFDDFFFDRPEIADRCGFITALGDEAVGFASWDPRKMPEYAIIGHNCMAARHKGKGWGARQLREAVHRIIQNDVKKIIVTTNELLIPAQRMYESVGFTELHRRKDEGAADFAGDYIDYEYVVRHAEIMQ